MGYLNNICKKRRRLDNVAAGKLPHHLWHQGRRAVLPAGSQALVYAGTSEHGDAVKDSNAETF